ncbi:MAG: hypothetical protein LBP91_05350, partial [Coriobacteriales bacterium]|jgi:hypothetical protein|nr:hypothetical protein [Coriobacteriales bacterium]
VTSGPAAKTLNYYSLTFSVTDAGTAAGSGVSASNAMASGEFVLAGTSLTLSASGAGATGGYSYLWSDSASTATATLAIADIQEQMTVSCTVRGWDLKYSATVNITKDTLPGIGETVDLYQSGALIATMLDTGGGTYSAAVFPGTYNISVGGAVTGLSVTVTSTGANEAFLDYFTLTLIPDTGITSIVGEGEYLVGAAVSISATLNPIFAWAQWIADPTTFGDIAAQSATITMPNYPLKLTATATQVAFPAIVTLRLNDAVPFTGHTVMLDSTPLADNSDGTYSAYVEQGTCTIFVDGADTGCHLTVSEAGGMATLDYYTVTFSATPIGTATSAGITANNGMLSGGAVLKGSDVALTVSPTGALRYYYLWSNYATTKAMQLSNITSPQNVTCTVKGVEVLKPTLVSIFLNAVAWPGKNVQLYRADGFNARLADNGDGTYFAALPSGAYEIYVNGEATGQSIQAGDPAEIINFYTVTFDAVAEADAAFAAVSASNGMASGEAVLAGTSITFTATGTGAADYTYAWMPGGTTGQTFASGSVTGPLTVSCTVSGNTAGDDTYPAAVNVFLDGVGFSVKGIDLASQTSGDLIATCVASGGVYTAEVPAGIYEIYAGNQFAGTIQVEDGGPNVASVNYYTVNYSATPGGTADLAFAVSSSGIISGGVVLEGTILGQLTAFGVGNSGSFVYEWFSTGSHDQALFIGSVVRPILDLCVVSGMASVFPATVYINGDFAPWTGRDVHLYNGGVYVGQLLCASDGSYNNSVIEGTHDIVVDGVLTGKTISVSNPDTLEAFSSGEANQPVQALMGALSNVASLDYFSVNFSATPAGAATGAFVTAADGIISGNRVLSGSSITLTAAGAGASSYTFKWSDGSTSESLTINDLQDIQNISVEVTGYTNHTPDPDPTPTSVLTQTPEPDSLPCTGDWTLSAWILLSLLALAGAALLLALCIRKAIYK